MGFLNNLRKSRNIGFVVGVIWGAASEISQSPHAWSIGSVIGSSLVIGGLCFLVGLGIEKRSNINRRLKTVLGSITNSLFSLVKLVLSPISNIRQKRDRSRTSKNQMRLEKDALQKVQRAEETEKKALAANEKKQRKAERSIANREQSQIRMRAYEAEKQAKQAEDRRRGYKVAAWDSMNGVYVLECTHEIKSSSLDIMNKLVLCDVCKSQRRVIRAIPVNMRAKGSAWGKH